MDSAIADTANHKHTTNKPGFTPEQRLKSIETRRNNPCSGLSRLASKKRLTVLTDLSSLLVSKLRDDLSKRSRTTIKKAKLLIEVMEAAKLVEHEARIFRGDPLPGTRKLAEVRAPRSRSPILPATPPAPILAEPEPATEPRRPGPRPSVPARNGKAETPQALPTADLIRPENTTTGSVPNPA